MSGKIGRQAEFLVHLALAVEMGECGHRANEEREVREGNKEGEGKELHLEKCGGALVMQRAVGSEESTQRRGLLSRVVLLH